MENLILMVKIQKAGNNSAQFCADIVNVYNSTNEYNHIFNFVDIFQQGGAAYDCAYYLMVKYDLAPMKEFYNDSLTKSDKLYFYETLPNRIIENCSALNVDFDSIFREVDENIKQYTITENKEDYAMGLLRPFANYLKIVSPILPETLRQREDEIKKGFSDILKGKHPQNSIESIYKIVWECLDKYTDLLEYTLAHNGISLFVLQDKTGIYITDRRIHIAHRYTQWTSDVDAKRIADYLNSKYKLNN